MLEADVDVHMYEVCQCFSVNRFLRFSCEAKPWTNAASNHLLPNVNYMETVMSNVNTVPCEKVIAN
jgi:hypothetical protein